MAVFEINAETGRVVSVTLPDELLNPFIKVESKKKKSKAQSKVKSFPHYKKSKKYSLQEGPHSRRVFHRQVQASLLAVTPDIMWHQTWILKSSPPIFSLIRTFTMETPILQVRLRPSESASSNCRKSKRSYLCLRLTIPTPGNGASILLEFAPTLGTRWRNVFTSRPSA
jgi:hypothetical protein